MKIPPLFRGTARVFLLAVLVYNGYACFKFTPPGVLFIARVPPLVVVFSLVLPAAVEGGGGFRALGPPTRGWATTGVLRDLKKDNLFNNFAALFILCFHKTVY